MRLTLVLLGWTLDLSLDPTATDEPDDTARDLSGGSTGTTVIEPVPGDRYMGFTNGREAE